TSGRTDSPLMYPIPRLALCILFAWAAAAASAPPPRRLVYLAANHHFSNAARTDLDIALLKRAAAAGYNGVVLEDTRLGILDLMPEAARATYRANAARLRDAAARAGLELIPQVCAPHGGRTLRHNPNLAEGLPVRDSRYVVRGGRLALEADRP